MIVAKLRAYAALSTAPEVRRFADDMVVATPEPFDSVARFYRHFDQTTDEKVRELLMLSGTAPVEAARRA